jgi:hypothetical protein
MTGGFGHIRKTIRALRQKNVTLYKQKYNFFKLYYGMGIGHAVFWSVAGYAGSKMLEKHFGNQANEPEMLWIAGSSLGLLSLGFILLVHRRARFSVAELTQIGESIEIVNNRILGRRIFHIPVKDVRLVEPRSKIMVAHSLVDIMKFHFRSVYKLETPMGTFTMNADGVTNLHALRKTLTM